MKATVFCRILLVALCAAPPTNAQPSARWTATIRGHEGVSELHADIPPALGLQRFDLVRADRTTMPVTNIEVDGTSIRLRLARPTSVDCKLDAVPARGYKGICVSEARDTAELTLVPPLAGMLLPEHEVTLARDAGPPNIARAASVFVLTPAGYTEVARGTNGFTCFIERPTPNDLWPMCQNREAAEYLLPVETLRMRLRAAGLPDDAVTDSVLGGYRRGRFRAPASGGMAYMLSRYAWTANRETNAPIFLAPHLHFYAPYATNPRVGVDTAERPVVPLRVEREGRADASIIVGVKLIGPTAPHP